MWLWCENFWDYFLNGCGVYCPNRQNTSRRIDNQLVEFGLFWKRENFRNNECQNAVVGFYVLAFCCV